MQLYQLDLRLREVTMRPNQLFGNVSLFCFGDICQLKPVMGRPIWSTPRSEEYLQAFLVDSYWEKFTVISLEENHRQEEDHVFADVLNRIRIGEQTIDDLNLLQERCRHDDHPDLKGAMTIAATHNIVNKNNDKLLDELNTELIVIEAINSHNNIPNFCPRIHPKKRTVAETPFLQTLRLKVNSRVMLTINLDVRDGLCNGSIGTLSNVIRDTHGEVKLLMVKFDNPQAGREMRRCHPLLAKKYPGCYTNSEATAQIFYCKEVQCKIQHRSSVPISCYLGV